VFGIREQSEPNFTQGGSRCAPLPWAIILKTAVEP
jgi:hypothetical protein